MQVATSGLSRLLLRDFLCIPADTRHCVLDSEDRNPDRTRPATMAGMICRDRAGHAMLFRSGIPVASFRRSPSRGRSRVLTADTGTHNSPSHGAFPSRFPVGRTPRDAGQEVAGAGVWVSGRCEIISFLHPPFATHVWHIADVFHRGRFEKPDVGFFNGKFFFG